MLSLFLQMKKKNNELTQAKNNAKDINIIQYIKRAQCPYYCLPRYKAL
jgi:hypothetical protein